MDDIEKPEKPISAPAPASAPASAPAPAVNLTTKQQAVRAWHDAATDDQKSAAVKQFPILVELYALAANFVPKE